MNRIKDLSIAALVAGAALATTSGVVVASNGGKHESNMTQPGDSPAISMQEVISRLERSGAQRILESEYEREDGRAVYEVKYIDADGQTREAYIDATDGQTLTDTDEDD